MQHFDIRGEPVTLIQLIKREPEWAESRINLLEDVLQNLLDEQNGPPLITREDQWQAAIDAARRALGLSGV